MSLEVEARRSDSNDIMRMHVQFVKRYRAGGVRTVRDSRLRTCRCAPCSRSTMRERCVEDTRTHRHRISRLASPSFSFTFPVASARVYGLVKCQASYVTMG